ncbi:biotin--[acetyl-CoA-carboxylase] ligase [Candidatus Rariloculus sp.]|uniref:biotin--[acetyl-CoA-carboxylase] ligase n=1 Tax=Candidatus Rariloculus sp. TaxID=3101265 RepID=UPI003D1119E5
MEAKALLQRLADGRPHSGEDLARHFGVTRAAVWKQIGKLEQWGLTVHRAPGFGYRLSRAVDLLDCETLGEYSSTRRGTRLEVFTELESTNRYLLDKRAPEPGELAACVAEHQSAGRGRRGRSWHAPLGAGVCLSAAWSFRETPPELAALSLAVGVVVRRVLRCEAGIEIDLKWPNDLVWDDRKLGGILVELTAEAQGRCHVVVGLGINVAMSQDLLERISDWSAGAVDLMQATAGRAPRRTMLVTELIDALKALFADYERRGFAPYRDEWRSADYLRGKPVRVDEALHSTIGTAGGISADGALLLETDKGSLRRVISGDVSVRPTP